MASQSATTIISTTSNLNVALLLPLLKGNLNVLLETSCYSTSLSNGNGTTCLLDRPVGMIAPATGCGRQLRSADHLHKTKRCSDFHNPGHTKALPPPASQWKCKGISMTQKLVGKSQTRGKHVDQVVKRFCDQRGRPA